MIIFFCIGAIFLLLLEKPFYVLIYGNFGWMTLNSSKSSVFESFDSGLLLGNSTFNNSLFVWLYDLPLAL